MLNKVHLIGHLSKEPEIKTNKQGEQFIVSFNIATIKTYKEKETGERKQRTEWHKIICFNKNILDLLTKYAAQGRQVYIGAKLYTTTYKKAGETSDRYSTQVVVEEVKLLGEKKEIIQE